MSRGLLDCDPENGGNTVLRKLHGIATQKSSTRIFIAVKSSCLQFANFLTLGMNALVSQFVIGYVDTKRIKMAWNRVQQLRFVMTIISQIFMTIKQSVAGKKTIY